MVILGIDPGTARCGYGLISDTKGRLGLIECGLIETPPNSPLTNRLQTIHTRLLELIDGQNPETVAVEELFFASNVKTALSVGQARGVILLAAALKGVPVAEYTPLQVKQAVTGYGRADKEQVRSMVKTILNLSELKGHDDASDALAIAICHVFSARMTEKLGSAAR